jgi:hypothetical protein
MSIKRLQLWILLVITAACARAVEPPVPRPAECPDPAQLCEIIAGQTKKKEATDSVRTAPADWQPLPGSNTTDFDVDWLYKHAADPSAPGEGICGLVGCFSDFLGGNRAAIVARCRNEPDDAAKVLCAVREVRQVLQADTTNVCRHYGIAIWWVLEDLGLESDLECSSNHVWVETKVNGKRVLVDAYNNIVIVVD